MDLELGGQTAIITGGGRGIGAAVARALAGEGCGVALVDAGAFVAAREVADAIRARGGRAIALEADVSDVDAAERCVATALEEFGHVDILVANAGVARDAVVWKMTEAQWDEVLDVNLKGCFAYCRAIAPPLRAQKHGRIVTMASINGLRGKFGQANYAASKAGVIALTKTLARELGSAGVTVNCVAPGLVRTEMTATLPAEVLVNAKRESALGRVAEPEDVAQAVAFLCSARARHITGTVMKVDGGQYI
ncbi:MAG: 3-oxoacyl-ACP reductase FabG [Gemmatimonadaceae bacterium]